MGRSSRVQAGENRARIVQVASDLFRARGIEAVGIADVMKAAGMTQGGFYKHFASKDALAAEACALAFASAAETWRDVARTAAAEGRDGAAAIADHYASVRPPSRTCPMIAFAADAARRSSGDPVQRAFREGVQTLFETFADAVQGDPTPEAGEPLRSRFAAMVGSNLLTRSVQQEAWASRAAPPAS